MLPDPEAVGRIEISLRQIEQLFNSLDPSAFHERELDSKAEAHLLGWAQELPSQGMLELSLHLLQPPSPLSPCWIEEAIHHHFAERASLKQGELRELFRQGRASLVIGLGFLAICLLLSRWLLGFNPEGMLADLLRESFLVAGWVAMWRPLQIYLYDWWPLRRQGDLLRRMSRMRVRLLVGGSSNPR